VDTDPNADIKQQIAEAREVRQTARRMEQEAIAERAAEIEREGLQRELVIQQVAAAQAMETALHTAGAEPSAAPSGVQPPEPEFGGGTNEDDDLGDDD